jgi:hypothetical protein
MSSSDCPTPTVSIRMRSNPNASSTSVTSFVARARPPSEPRVAIQRLSTGEITRARPARLPASKSFEESGDFRFGADGGPGTHNRQNAAGGRRVSKPQTFRQDVDRDPAAPSYVCQIR